MLTQLTQLAQRPVSVTPPPDALAGLLAGAPTEFLTNDGVYFLTADGIYFGVPE